MLDHTSILRFIEDNWRLAPLARRDARANTLAHAFEFEKAPRRPAITAASRTSSEDPEPRRGVIYLWYGAAVLLAAMLIRYAGRRRAAATPFALLALTVVAAPGPARAAVEPVPPVIETNPPTPGMRFSVEGSRIEADATGRAYPPAAVVGSEHGCERFRRSSARACGPASTAGIATARGRAGSRSPREGQLRRPRRPARGSRSGPLGDADGQQRPPSRLRRGGDPLAAGEPGRARERWTEIDARLIRSRAGSRRWGERRPSRPAAVLPGQEPGAPPAAAALLARFEVRDALLGFPIGSAVRLRFPNGRADRYPLGSGGEVTVSSLPRGDYRVSADALGHLVVAAGRAVRRPARRAAGDQLARHRHRPARARVGGARPPVRAPARAGAKRRVAARCAGICVRCSRLPAPGRPSTRIPCSPTTTSGSTARRGTVPRPTIRCSGATRATTAA